MAVIPVVDVERWLGSAGRRYAAIFCFLPLGLPVSASGQISAFPAIVNLSPGETATVGVRNVGDTPSRLRYSLGDFEQQENGEHQFLAPGSHERSCAPYLTIFPQGITLLPGEAGSITVRLSEEVETCWSVLFVERPPEAETGVRITQRIAVKVNGVPRQPRRAAEILSVERVSLDEGVGVRITMENLGNVALRPEGRLEIRSGSGEVLTEETIESFSALPGHRRFTVIPLSRSIPPGVHLVIPILDIGASSLLGAQERVEFTGPGELPMKLEDVGRAP